MITGPRLIPKSENPVNVPMAGPREDPILSIASTNNEGKRKACPIPHIPATRMNMGKDLEKARMAIEMAQVMRQGRITRSLL